MNKRIAALAALILCALCLAGCSSKYKSSYNAVGFVHSNTSDEAEMSFSSFSGTMVFKLNCDEDGEAVEYYANLGSGSATVWIDADGTKTELFRVYAGDSVHMRSDPIRRGTVYIIVESDGECRSGTLSFDLD